MKKIHILIITFVFLVVQFSVAQEERTQNRIGISASLQNGQAGFLIPIWLGQNAVIAPAIDVFYAEKIGTDIGLSLMPKFYFKETQFSPYLGLRFGMILNVPSPDNTTDPGEKMDVFIGPSFGGEYFFNEHFSLAIELQGNFTQSHEKSFRFGNPDGLNFNTATVLLASMYF